MKTISLEEAKQAATSEKFKADLFGPLRDQAVLQTGSGIVVLVCGKSATKMDEANTALLAHRWNTHDELVEALEKAIELASMEDGDYYKADDAGEVERVKAVLARAKTVDTP